MTVAVPTRTTEVQSQNDQHWQGKRASQPANGLLRPTVNWASALPDDTRPHALLAKFPRIANLRPDKPPDEIDSLETVRAIYEGLQHGAEQLVTAGARK